MGKVGPLSGIKVLDFTAFVSGTTCTEQLGWMGADVYKVERPAADGVVSDGAFLDFDYAMLNHNKKSITCNVKTPEGLELMKKMVAKCDVLVENMNPGAIERMGLSYEVCSEINPRIVFCQIKGFGPDGPYTHYPAFNSIAVAMGGMGAGIGLKGGEPIIVGPADPASGFTAAYGILAALMQRERTGKGQKVYISMQEVIMALSGMTFMSLASTGHAPIRAGNDMAGNMAAPHNIYRCKPGGENDYVQIYCSRHPGSKQFDTLCKVIGREDLITDPRAATPLDRYNNREFLDKIIEEWTMQYTKQEVMEKVAGANVPCGAVLDVEDLANDEYLKKSGAIFEFEHRGKTVAQPGFTPRLSDYTPDYTPAPTLGNANEEVYKDMLGVSDEDFKAMMEKHAI